MNEPVQDHEFQWFEVRDLTNLSALNPGQPPKQPDPQEQVKPSLHTQEQVKPSFFWCMFSLSVEANPRSGTNVTWERPALVFGCTQVSASHV